MEMEEEKGSTAIASILIIGMPRRASKSTINTTKSTDRLADTLRERESEHSEKEERAPIKQKRSASKKRKRNRQRINQKQSGQTGWCLQNIYYIGNQAVTVSMCHILK